jgi:2-dehydropantoate 2-reductase
MRIVVYGAGAIGGLAGGLMTLAGVPVTLIARGEHGAAMQADGLVIASAVSERTVAVEVATSPSEVAFDTDTAVLLCTKAHQTAAALEELRRHAPPDTPVACLQNGVDNERSVLRLFRHVYPVCVMCPAGHLEPGVVRQDSVPVPGLLDVGLYPSGSDPVCSFLAGAFRAGGFDSIVQPDIMRWKYRKLLMNLGNAVEALCHPPGSGELVKLALAEGEACLQAAGIDYASAAEDRARRGDIMKIEPVPGRPRGGGSSWQSLTRGTGNIESDYLNGEIVLLGRLHGVATPVNDVLQDLAVRAAREGLAPGSYAGDEVMALALGR